MLALVVGIGLALAQEPAVDAPAPRLKPFVWSGIGVPAINYNLIDGFGLGAGVVLYDRPRGEAYGFRYMLTLYSYWTTTGNYGSSYVQLERRGRHPWMVRLHWRLWRNMVYVGEGGDDVIVRNGEEAFGNSVNGPSLLANVTRRLRGTPVNLWGQTYVRYTMAGARAGGPLDQARPLGVNGGLYFDLSAGASVLEVDRWPVPNKGVRAEASVRAGGTAAEGRFEPLVGVNVEAAGYAPLAGEWLVLGGRVLFDKSWGERPFWEMENLGGLARDEIAYEQMLTGYARSRSRGDGVLATMVELRPKFGETGHDVVDIGFYGSVFGELGWLFRDGDPGPPLPSVGVAPYFVWQGAVELRPFLSWGWMSDAPGLTRTPQMQVGVSLLGAL